MLRRGSMIVGSLLALMFFTTPSWAQFRGRAMMGSMAFHAPNRAFVGSARSFPATGTFGGGSSFGTMSGSRFAPVQTFNPVTGNLFTTTPFGTFATNVGPFPTVNSYNPATRITTMTTPFGAFNSTFQSPNPASFVSPLANSAVNQAAYNHTLRQVERYANGGNFWNPYFYGGYGYPNPYAAYGSYGAGAGYGGYGAGSGYGAGAPSAAGANSAPAQPAGTDNVYTAQPRQPSALSAFGIPVEFGAVKWPLAMRLMPPDVKRDLLDKLESQMKVVASQAVSGNASQPLLRETKSTIDNVRGWLRGRRSNMAESTYQDGDTFLRNLEDSLRRMDS